MPSRLSALAAAVLFVIPFSLFGQALADKTAGKHGPALGRAAVRRLPDGKPDLSGYWSNNTATPLQRPAQVNGRELLTAQEAKAVEFNSVRDEHEAACREALEKVDGGRNRGPFTPYSVEGALVMPYILGGATWSGGAFDPTLGYYVINTIDSGEMAYLKPQEKEAGPDVPRATARVIFDLGPSETPRLVGWPCWQPPWGRLTAINVNTGDVAWQVPFGTMEGVPANIKTGAPNLGGGPLTTAGGLIFIGAARDNLFRAFETKTGKELWSVRTENVAHANPISYMGKDGKQYIAIAAGTTFLTYRLP